MDTRTERLAEEALALPAAARADLAHRLLASLDEDVDVDAEAASLAEALHRSEEIDQGAVTPVSGDEIFRRVRARLR